MFFQMTMPVTLVAVARMMPARLATAFGWTCLALAVGSLPTMFGWGNGLVSKPMQAGWILLATGAVLSGLRLSGVAWRVADRREGTGDPLRRRVVPDRPTPVR